MFLLVGYINDYHPIVLGPDTYGTEVAVILKDGNHRHYRYLGYLPLQQAFNLPDARKVKVSALGTCDSPQGHGLQVFGEGWFVLGVWVKTGVFVVTKDERPVTFFAPVGFPSRSL